MHTYFIKICWNLPTAAVVNTTALIHIIQPSVLSTTGGIYQHAYITEVNKQLR
jgi:hypothetical protein